MTTTRQNPPMPLEIALEFVRATMEPYNGSWSGMWLWEQPDEDDMVTVGEIYGHPPFDFNVSEIIDKQKNPNDSVEAAKRDKDLLDLVNLASRLWGDGEDETDTNSGYLDFNYCPNMSDILCSQDFTIPFHKMNIIDKIKYRFAMMFVNGPAEGHNWACSFLEEVGYRYYSLSTEPVVWEGHDCDDDLSRFIDEVNKRGYVFPAEPYELYHGEHIHDDDYTQDTFDWLVDEDARSSIIPQYLWSDYGNEAAELIELFAYAVEYVQEAWDEGNLLLGASAPKPILDWMNENGIAPVAIKKTVYDAIRDGSLWGDS